MIPDVYVLFKDGLPATRNLYDAWNGFKTRGHRVFPFDVSDIDNLSTTKEDIVAAGIPVIHKTWKRLGVEVPTPINYPTCLQPFMQRSIKQLTVGDIRKLNWPSLVDVVCHTTKHENPTPIFIKPYDMAKSFTGFLLSGTKDLFKIAHLDYDVKLWASTPVTFLTEWRVYVLKGEILGIGHYTGSPTLFPKIETIEKMIGTYQASGTAPVAYSLDVADMGNSTTGLVEINFAYALGNYSLPSTLYAKLMEAAWFEVVNK